jgi:hypothetical protein
MNREICTVCHTTIPVRQRVIARDGPIITLAFTAKGANGASSKVDLVSRGV